MFVGGSPDHMQTYFLDEMILECVDIALLGHRKGYNVWGRLVDEEMRRHAYYIILESVYGRVRWLGLGVIGLAIYLSDSKERGCHRQPVIPKGAGPLFCVQIGDSSEIWLQQCKTSC